MENRTNAKQAIMEEFAHFHLPDGRWRMYVKPYTANLKEDLENYRKSASATSIEVTEENGTYCITSKEIIEHFCDMRNTLWFMIFWRLRCEARNTFATEIVGGNCRKLRWSKNEMKMGYTEENMNNYFYVVTLSPDFIEATRLPRFQIPQCA